MANYSSTKDHFITTEASSATMTSMHYHNSYEIYFLEAGNREYFVEDKYFSVSAGSFVLIPKMKFHRTGGTYGLRTLVGFTDEFLKKTYSDSAIEQMLRCFNNTLVIPDESKHKRFNSLLKHLATAQSENEFSLYLGVLMCELSMCKGETSYDEQISRIISYINANYSEIHNIEQIADFLYISKYHLCHTFKKAMGITVIDYLNSIKIKSACNLITSTDKGFLEISQLCGFNSSAYFSKVFKDITGVSPSYYKKHPEI
jgi:AraC-like DNA-binding protein